MQIRETLEAIRQEGSKILIVGLGISGIESAKFCIRNKINSVVVEREEEQSFLKKTKFKKELDQLAVLGAEIHFGVDGERLLGKLEGVKLAILSPGVPLESAVCAVLRRHNIPYISELEVGIELQERLSVVVTGSNGKSTTVSLVDAIFQQAGWNSTLCGNVGVPVIAGTEDMRPDSSDYKKSVLVVEASSYQLETCTLLKPRVAALTNISENHLERHGDINRYLKIKSKIFQKQDVSDLAILNADDPKIAALASEIKATIAAFGIGDYSSKYSKYAHIQYAPANGQDSIVFGKETYSLKNAKLRGMHNRFNAAVAIIACRELGVTQEDIQKVLIDFAPLEHRLEYLGKQRGVECINDSKSTTVAASMAALSTVLHERGKGKITLMIGGLSKAGSWDPLCKQITANIDSLNKVVCFGKDSSLIANYCKTFKIPHLACPTLSLAVDTAFRESETDGIILFSPGCASFDEFSDFEERGRVFKTLTQSMQTVA